MWAWLLWCYVGMTIAVLRGHDYCGVMWAWLLRCYVGMTIAVLRGHDYCGVTWVWLLRCYMGMTIAVLCGHDYCGVMWAWLLRCCVGMTIVVLRGHDYCSVTWAWLLRCYVGMTISEEQTVSVIRVEAELEYAPNTRSYTVLAKTTMMWDIIAEKYHFLQTYIAVSTSVNNLQTYIADSTFVSRHRNTSKEKALTWGDEHWAVEDGRCTFRALSSFLGESNGAQMCQLVIRLSSRWPVYYFFLFWTSVSVFLLLLLYSCFCVHMYCCPQTCA